MTIDAPEQPRTAAPTFDHKSYRGDMVCCRVCGRTLLMGERSSGFFTVSGEGPFEVCQLCVPRAHRFGLRSQPSTADEVAQSRRAGAMAHLTATLRSVVSGGSRGPSRRARSRRASKVAAPTPLDPAALGTMPVGSAAIPAALAAFNGSPHARTLSGLHRTLGQPRASVAPRSATDREVILTVAWEIVWYQFRIMPDGIEQHRGQYLSELLPRWQNWNCEVATDGQVREAGELRAADGQDNMQNAPAEAPVR